MDQHEPPEISFGKGRLQITLRGEEAIRAAGWAVPMVLFLRGLAPFVLTALGLYAASRCGVSWRP